MQTEYEPDDSIGRLLVDVSRLIRRLFDQRARSIGVTRPQYQVLTALSRREGCNQGHLAEVLDVEPITLCRMIDRLQDAGWVERRRDPADRRAWQLYLSPQALELLEILQPLGNEVLDAALAGIPDQQQDMLRQTLLRMRHNLAQPSENTEVPHQSGYQ